MLCFGKNFRQHKPAMGIGAGSKCPGGGTDMSISGRGGPPTTLGGGRRPGDDRGGVLRISESRRRCVRWGGGVRVPERERGVRRGDVVGVGTSCSGVATATGGSRRPGVERGVWEAARLMLPSLGDRMTEGECGGTGLSTCKRMNRVKPGVWVEV